MLRMFVLGVLAVGVPSALGSQSAMLVDYAASHNVLATADGQRVGLEYDMTPIPMSQASGGGGALSAPTAALMFNTQPPREGLGALWQTGFLNIGFQPGATVDHTVIILLNYRAGGRTRGSGGGVAPLNDTTDAARRALSSLQGMLPSGPTPVTGTFETDAAITINADGFGIFLFPDDAHATFTQIGAYGQGEINPLTGFREVLVGGSAFVPNPPHFFATMPSRFDFAVVYADNGYLYNEALPAQPYSAGANPGLQIGVPAPADVPNFYTLDVYIPAPGAAVAMFGAIIFAIRREGNRRDG